MLSGLTIETGYLIGVLFAGEGYSPHPQLFLVACSSLCRVEAWVSCARVLPLLRLCFGSYVGETSRVWFLAFLRDTLGIFRALSFSQPVCPLFHSDP